MTGPGNDERPDGSGDPARPAPPEPARTAPLERPSPYGPKPSSGWTGGSPTALPQHLPPHLAAARPVTVPHPTHATAPAAAQPSPPLRPPAGTGVPSRPEPLPPPRPAARPADDPTQSLQRGAATTVVPGRRPAERPSSPLAARPGKNRKAKLALRRLDPWSVFVMSLLLSLFLAVVTIVASVVLYAVLERLGIPQSINKTQAEIQGGNGVLTRGRFVGGAALLAALNVVLLTLLATLGSLLYNLCASFTGGLELTLAERD